MAMKTKEYEVASFARKEDRLEYLFKTKGPFWHLCTPGTNQEIIFHSEEDYNYGITTAAMSLASPVRILATAVMSNHIHDILSGTERACLDYFERRKSFLRRYCQNKGLKVDFSLFNCSLLPIENLSALRTEIVYVNRNGYLVNRQCTPFSYRWSTGMYYFNPAASAGGRPFSELTYREKRLITHSRLVELPCDYQVRDGAVLIPSFVCIKEGENYFSDAHQYFNMLSRNREAYGEVAKRLGDEVFLTDNELFDAICGRCRKQFGESRPAALSPNDKIAAAVMMKKEYHASNGQIRRMLKLSDQVVKELFP